MTINDFYRFKKKVDKIAMVTCYDYSIASVIADTNIDCVLVGDSVSMVVYGYESTIHATMEMMKLHVTAVKNGLKNSKMIIADMPFMSFRKNKYESAENASVLIKAGADAVKIEGIDGHEETIKYIIESGIPVMGHLGLTPQYIKSLGRYSIQGKDEKTAEKIFSDAIKLEKIGCFSIVLECVPEKLATEITKKLKIPTIGIGSGKKTDGQVLVINDMIGLFPSSPSFVKKYLNLSEEIKKAMNDYSREVKDNENN
ncbi:MAG: 3-methyl-2-oxobutanoate hydroxymethyltransferase [Elusimicrobiota bacterium]